MEFARRVRPAGAPARSPRRADRARSGRRAPRRRRRGDLIAHRMMALLRLILFCSWMMPYSNASAVGGQPGTYTSTGTMRSHPAHHGIRIMIVAAAVRARAHGNHPARLGHLVVHLAQRRRHLVDQRAGDDHDVGLPGARTKHHAEAVEIVARGTRMHHLDRAARESERHRPERAGARPVDELVDRGHFEAAHRAGIGGCRL